MKLTKFISLIAVGIAVSSCSDWLEQENLNDMSADETYSADAGVTSIVSNLYTQLTYWQDFSTDGDSYDLCRWDEALNNSQYWNFAGNVGSTYREIYPYRLIRDLNQHIENLNTISAGKISDDNRKYYIAEARWMRAYTYFRMVVQMGGVPLITEVTPYTENPAELAKPRDTEAAIYDFIISEMDAIKGDFGNSTVKTRATRGAALALKCRAALYAGTLAYNFDKSAAKHLNLNSGATGISKEKAAGYLQKCIEAADELTEAGYSLYKVNADPAQNYYEMFTVAPASNPELIFCKAYDGVNVTNSFTTRAIPRSITAADKIKSSCQINPTLNLVNDYELVNGHQMVALDAYVGEEKTESMSDMTSSEQYNLFDNPGDIFAGRDPRLEATVILPGSSFRGSAVDLQAGLAIPNGSGYEFKAARTVTGLDETFEGQRVTGQDGPIRDGDGNWYVSHSGFLMRKFVDSATGSELNGSSQVCYPVFRYGEALLNASEAAFYLNQLGVASVNGKSTAAIALDYMNQVRERAGGNDFKINASELTFDRIVNERRVELAFEDHRYEDMKRWRLADEQWHADEGSETATIWVLWPYKVYNPGGADDGKWLYRKMRAGHRANNGLLSFDETMYYNLYPMNEGNPNIEKNPNH